MTTLDLPPLINILDLFQISELKEFTEDEITSIPKMLLLEEK